MARGGSRDQSRQRGTDLQDEDTLLVVYNLQW